VSIAQDVAVARGANAKSRYEAGASSPALAPGQCSAIVTDDQLLKAIESLEVSTSMIEKHTQTLDMQREALQSLLLTRNNTSRPSPSSARLSRQYENDVLDFTVILTVCSVRNPN